MVKRKRSSASRPRRTRRRTRTRKRLIRYRPVSTGLPDSKFVTLRYVTFITLNPSIATNVSHIFRANSIYDPDQTGIGHKPMGTDQFNTFYDHYTVVGSKITATFMSGSGSASAGTAICGVLLKDNLTTINTPERIAEAGNSSFRVLTNSSATGKTKVSAYYSATKFFGLKDIRDNRDLIGSQFSASPTEDALFHVWASPHNGSVDPNPIDVMVTITYRVLLSERKNLPQS